MTADLAKQPYHRLFRTLDGFRWWRPLVALLLAGVYYVVFSVVVAVPVLVLAVVTGRVSIDDPARLQSDLGDLAVLDAASPISLLLALGSLAVMLPAVHLALLSTGLRPTGVRHSVAFRLRWRWLWQSSVPAFVIVVAATVVPILIGSMFGEEALGGVTTEPVLFLGCVAIILVLTPFQAAAEEYVFRGFLAQMLGSWVRYAPVAIIVPTAAFASLHIYDAAGLASVAIFGLGAAYVVWRTGGLEAGITYHALNNISAFLFLASGVYGTTVNESETASNPAEVVLVVGSTLIATGVWVAWVLWLAKRKGIVRLGGRVDPAPAIDEAGMPQVPAPLPPV
ncbi:MAG: CPBP family intramembrane glutamic endopeptidase [Pseudolysinimonas sp.]